MEKSELWVCCFFLLVYLVADPFGVVGFFFFLGFLYTSGALQAVQTIYIVTVPTFCANSVTIGEFVKFVELQDYIKADIRIVMQGNSALLCFTRIPPHKSIASFPSPVL